MSLRVRRLKRCEGCPGGAPVSVHIVPKFDNEIGLGKDLADNVALEPDALPVDDPDLVEAQPSGLEKVLADDGSDLLGPKRMEVEFPAQRDMKRVVIRHFFIASFLADLGLP